jgi:hypothetical protein
MSRYTLCAVLLTLGATPVLAHAIRAVVSVTETQVVVTVSFDGDDDLRGDVFVRLEDEGRNELGKLKLSGSNVATFNRPATDGVYFVVAEDDGFGHRVEKRIVVKSGRVTEDAQPDRSQGSIKIVQGVVGILFATVLAYLFLRKSGKAQHGS